MLRRDFLKRSGTTLALAGMAPAMLVSPAARAAALRGIGMPAPFDYAWLKGQARAKAGKPYSPVDRTVPPEIESLNWDQYQAIRFRRERALWGDERLRFQAQFFHLGLFFKRPVRMFEVSDGLAQELAYDPALFDHGDSGLADAYLPENLGFAGFRLNFHTDPVRDVVAFLGASYFRAVGGEWQYGLSARGLAVDTAMDGLPEEFPDFTAFWLERPQLRSSTVVVYALLDSPSVSGAYRFVITPGDTLVMDVDAAIYPRTEIERIGIAPGTSMYQVGENDRRMGYDWRPEIHDSDGLAMWTGAGEWIWRPLNNPAQLRFNAFQDHNPRGFGLLQRDRNFEHYQDDGVFYERRPSLWVEPKGDWGSGSVHLVEIPTVDETFDNIVAFWNPVARPQAGQELLYGYRLHWGAQPPVKPSLAHCVATRTGLGGVVGRPREYFSWRFAVDFTGGDFALLAPGSQVEAVISTSRGKIETVSARPLQSVNGYRAMFDLVPDGDSTQSIDLRLFLQHDGQALTETWLYQYDPPPPDQRKLW